MPKTTAAANEARRRKDAFGRHNVNLSTELDERIRARLSPKHGRSAEIERSVGRYYDLLEKAEGRLEHVFTPDDLSTLEGALHGTVFDAVSIPNLWMSIADAGHPALSERVKGFGLAELYALAERLERP